MKECSSCTRCRFFFFNDTATTEIYTLSLHDALPISPPATPTRCPGISGSRACLFGSCPPRCSRECRSEEHTSELQSRLHLVCRLLLEKKKPATARQHARHHRRKRRRAVHSDYKQSEE